MIEDWNKRKEDLRSVIKTHGNLDQFNTVNILIDNDKQDYSKYVSDFNSKEISLLRGVLKNIEDNHGGNSIEDSSEHNAIIRYFNDKYYHRMLTPEEFSEYKS